MYFESSEIWIGDQFMGRDHFVGTNGNKLAFILYHGYNNRQTIEFCEVFLFNFELLSIEENGVLGVLPGLDEYLFMLSSEHICDIFDFVGVLVPGGG